MEIENLAQHIKEADALCIILGAGMGVDSGFATFRGEDGLWPSLEKRLGIPYLEWATPQAFHDPEVAWGFYGRRLEIYRETPPHEGYHILRRWRDTLFEPGATFVYTTNVDEHALRTFPVEEVCEVHGSLFWGQHQSSHASKLQDLHDHVFDISPEDLKCTVKTLPRDAQGSVLRPAVLLFEDFYSNRSRYYQQVANYLQWQLRSGVTKVAVLEIGCGDEVLVGRQEALIAANMFKTSTLIRINPSEYTEQDRKNKIHHLQCGALEGLKLLDNFLRPTTSPLT